MPKLDFGPETPAERAVRQPLKLDFGPAPMDQVVSGLDADPDRAAKALQLGRQYGVPGPMVEIDPKFYEERQKREQAAAALSRSTELQAFVERNPNAARIVNDEYEALALFAENGRKIAQGEQTWLNGAGQQAARLGTELSTGWEGTGYGRDYAFYGLGMLSRERAIKEFEAKQRTDSGHETVFSDPIGVVGQFAGGMANNVLYGGTAGAAAGGGIGLVVGGPAGAATGAVMGAGVGVVADMGLTTYGSIYSQLDKVRQKDGSPLNEITKQAGSAFGSAVVLTTSMMGGYFSGKATEALIVGAVSKMLGTPAGQAAVTKAAGALAGAGIGGGAMNVGMEVGIMAVQDIAKMTGDVKDDPKRMQEYADTAARAFINGAALFGTIGSIPIGHTYIADRARIAQVKRDKAALDAAMAAAVEIKLRERSPQDFEDFASFAHGEQRIPAQVLAELRQKDPEAFGYVEGIDQKIAEAAPHAGDIAIPSKEYFGKTRPEDHAAVSDQIRSNAGLTLKEALELEEGWTKAQEAKPSAPQEPTPEGFTTARGSTYIVHEDGTTTRNKAERADVGHEGDKGLKPQTAKTVYVSEEDAGRLATPQNTWRVIDHGDGTLSIATQKEDGRWGIAPSQRNVPVSDKPAVGLTPVELWKPETVNSLPAYGTVHFGNAITEVRTRGEATINPSHDRYDLIGYHGSQEVIKEFDPQKTRLGRGVFFAEKPEISNAFAEGRMFDSDPHWFPEDPNFVEKVSQLLSKEEGDKLAAAHERWQKGEEELANREDRGSPEYDQLSNATGEAYDYMIKESEKASAHFTYDDDMNLVPATPNMTKVRLRLGKNYEIDMGGEFNWGKELEAINHARDNGYDSVTIRNYDNSGRTVHSVFDPKNIRPFWDIPETLRNDPGANTLVTKTLDAVESTQKALKLEPVLMPEAPPADITVRPTKPRFLDPVLVPDALGMSKADFTRWSKHIQDLQAAIEKGVFDGVQAEIKRRETKLWKHESALEAERVLKDMHEEPDIAAERILRGEAAGEFGEFKTRLHPDDINELFSAEEQKAMGGTPSELLRRGLVGEKESLPLDAIAELSGHGSGRELVEGLIGLERERRARGETPKQQFDRRLREETKRRMEERYGNLEERILNEAMEHALSVKQVEIFIDDLERIAKGGDLGPVQLTKELLLEDIAKRFQDMPHKEAIRVKDFERRIGQAGAAVEKALLKGDFLTAFHMKQVQMRNFLMAKEARVAARTAGAVGRLMDTMSKNITIEGWSQEHLDHGHWLLASLGIEIPRTLENIMEATAKDATFANWRERRSREFREDIEPLPADFPTDAEVLTVAQTKMLWNTLESLRYHARQAERLIKGEETEAFYAIKSGMMDELAEHAKHWNKFDSEASGIKGIWQGTKKVARTSDAMLYRIEQFMLDLDKGNPNGLWSQSVFRPLKEAQHYFDKWMGDVAEQLSKLPGDAAWRRSLNQEVTNSLLRDKEGNVMRFRRKNLVSMILNMGNESNFRKLVEGYGWDRREVTDWVFRNARKEDYDFAQAMWKVLESNWEKIADAHKEATGVRPERVPPQALDTPFGRLQGGYFPLLRDWEQRPFANGDLMNGEWISPFVSEASSTRSRTGATYQIALDLDALGRNLRETLHAASYTTAVRNAAKVIRDPDIMASIRERYGPEYESLLLPWLRDIAHDGERPSSILQKRLEGWSAAARQRAVFMMIGFRPSTALIHGGAALFNSITEQGLRGFAGAAKDRFLSTPDSLLSATDQLFYNPNKHESLWNWALEQSGELTNRIHNYDRDMGNAMNRIALGRNDWGKVNAYYGSWAIAKLDLMSAVVVWLSEYKEQRATGKNHLDAVYNADVSVRQAHGSSALMDQPAIQRMNEFAKWGTAFYGYFNHNYNRTRTIVKDLSQLRPGDFLSRPKDAFGEVGQAAMHMLGYVVMPAIIHEWVRPHVAKDEDETMAKGLAKAVQMQFTSQVPIVRDLAQAWSSGRKAEAFGLLGQAGQAFLDPLIDIKYAIDPEQEIRHDTLKHALALPGWALKFPISNTVAGWAQYAIQGNEKSETDFRRLILDGNPQPRKPH